MTPAPIAGGGGVPGSYQRNFNIAVWQSKPPAFQPLYNGLSGAPNEKQSQLSLTDRNALLKSLFASGALVDPWIDQGLDPFTAMYAREDQNWAWVKSGTGLDTSTEVMGQGNSLPAPPGTIIVSTNIADYVPNPQTMLIVNPPPPAPPPIGSKIPNPVGARMTFTSANALGDTFRQLVDKNGQDGYLVADTWTGTAGAYSGTWTKVAEMMGMEICWQMVQSSSPVI
jgi:hypothetical protein